MLRFDWGSDPVSRISPSLLLPHLPVAPLLRQKFLMAAALRNPSMLHDIDSIRQRRHGKPVRNHEHALIGMPLQQRFVKRILCKRIK